MEGPIEVLRLKSSHCIATQMGLIYSTVELIRLLSSIIQLEALWGNRAQQPLIADQTQITTQNTAEPV